jgi:hypothetical protein
MPAIGAGPFPFLRRSFQGSFLRSGDSRLSSRRTGAIHWLGCQGQPEAFPLVRPVLQYK